jgi:DNA-binding NarL/FixJ family response regulator
MIRVILADDQVLIRSGLRALLGAELTIRVVGEAGTGREAVSLAQELHPDVVVMDLRMPDGDGVWATKAIASDPQLTRTRVLVLTTFDNDDFLMAALRAGASGFLGKGVDPEQLVRGIQVVHDGGGLLSPTATRQLISHVVRQPGTLPDPALLRHLTAREREIVVLVAQGLSNAEIADHLVVSPLTVKTHVAHALGKAGARDRAQLVVLAYQSGLVQP